MRPKRPLDHKHTGLHEIDWNEFTRVCRKLALEIDGRGGCDATVGLGKGGAIVGAMLAAMLRCDYYALRFSRRHAGERTRQTTRVTLPPNPELTGRRLLLCDDLSVTGETFKIALLELRRVNPEKLTTLAFAAHEKGYCPDLCGIRSDDAFVFPWDREVLQSGTFQIHPDIAQAIETQGLRKP